MSQEYYVVCEDHKEMIRVGQSAWGRGITFYSGEPDCMEALGEFLHRHFLCDCRFLWENVDTQDGVYKEYDWHGNLIVDDCDDEEPTSP